MGASANALSNQDGDTPSCLHMFRTKRRRRGKRGEGHALPNGSTILAVETKSTSTTSMVTDLSEDVEDDCIWKDEKVVFKSVYDDDTEVTAVVTYAGLLTNLGVFDRAIGQVQFRLKDLCQ